MSAVPALSRVSGIVLPEATGLGLARNFGAPVVCSPTWPEHTAQTQHPQGPQSSDGAASSRPGGGLTPG